jgi:hypothetical protein
MSDCYCKRKGCRPGRPLCRRADAKPRNARCYCCAYAFPHRVGSGACLSNPKGPERLNELIYGVQECPF